MGYPFGKDIIYTFYPLVDNKEISLPTQSPTIYVFTEENKPTLDAAQNGTNKLFNAITQWTERGTGRDFIIPAIPDPSPDSTKDRYTYYLGINFILQAAGSTQTIIRALDMERVQAHHKTITITYSDVISYFPQVESYISIQHITRFIQIAKEELKTELHNKSYEWAQIYRPDRLTLACIFKVMMYAMASQRKSPGDPFDLNFDLYKETYQNFMQGLKLEYDTDRDGEPQEELVKTDIIYLIR